jgi:hypothetical protein
MAMWQLDLEDGLKIKHVKKLSKMLKVYFENESSSTLVATFDTEEMYMACLPTLIKLADESRHFITESIEDVPRGAIEYAQELVHATIDLLSSPETPSWMVAHYSPLLKKAMQ